MDQIIGQARALEILQAALQSGPVHHAFIFHGPAGVGKFTSALAFAKVLLCHNAQPGLTGQVSACGACPSCLLLAKTAGADQTTSAHPDLHVITKELARYSDDKSIRERKLMTIPIDIVRDNLIGPAFRSAVMRHGKVFIVDEAELLSYGNDAAQNAMLKVLEEPPAGTVIILITAHEDKLLPTIRSRCQRVVFMPLPDEVIERWLDQNVEAAKAWSAAQRHWLINFAGGSLGRAALAVEYDLAAWARAVLPALEQMARGQFPAGLGNQMAQGIGAFAEHWVDKHENASKEAANKLAGSLMWVMIGQHARRKMAGLATKAPAGDLEATESLLAPWLGAIEALSGAEAEIAANVNLGLACDHLVSRLYRALSARDLPVEA